jgi:endonuclease-3
MSELPDFAGRLARVRDRIAQAATACGRQPAEVVLLAVSKTHPAALVRQAHAAGLRAFGENRVQELAAKAAALADLPDLQWHLIGSLQTNKLRALSAVPGLALVHSLDRWRLAEALQREWASAGRSLDVLLQIHATREVEKHGCPPAAAAALLAQIQRHCPNLRVQGLMAMGPREGDPRPVFDAVAALREQLRQATGLPLPLLSLGMSGDLEPAIAAGSTLLRIGSALFGERGLPPDAAPATLSPATMSQSSLPGRPAAANAPPAPAGDTTAAVLAVLAQAIPEPRCELDHCNPWSLLVATILSAQSTDRTVNTVTPVLFGKWPTPAALAAAPREEVEAVVHRTGFFRNKAKAIQEASAQLVAEHGGEVPRSMAALLKLPGVARKTANVVLGVAFQQAEGIAVDTHVMRVAQRLGWTAAKSAEKVEAELCRRLPRDRWVAGGHRLLLLGRYVCTARQPRCEQCPVQEHCPSQQAAAVGSVAERIAAVQALVATGGQAAPPAGDPA